jgi:hypothetical protein
MMEAWGDTLAPPAVVATTTVCERWPAVAGRAEVACIEAWSAACRAWWEDARDGRLRELTSGALLLGGEELAGWLARRLDTPALILAHQHVTCMRAGLERDLALRDLAAGLRSRGALVLRRGGGRTMFMDAGDVAAEVARFADALDALPAHPLVRGAWLMQAIGVVHPFADGNGGTSRFLASLELVRAHLPPLVLTVEQRNGAYIDGLTHSNRTGDLGPLVVMLYEVVQQLIATALLARGGERGAWDARACASAERWVAMVERRWRAAVGAPPDGEPVRADPAGSSERGAAIARLIRRGYRVPIAPEPRLARWRLAAPLPVELDLVIAPVRAAGVAWLVAMLGASAGDGGALGSAAHGEVVSGALVAPATEDDVRADARFERWVELRLDQCVRGLARWV